MRRPAGRRKRGRSGREAGAAVRPPRPTGDPPARMPWRDVAIVAAIILFAFALRMTYVSQMRDSPFFGTPFMDEQYHDDWAKAIAAGETFVDGPYFRAPLYPALLAMVYKVFGHGLLAPRVVQAVLGSLSCGLLFLIGRRAFGWVIGSVAGFLAAGYWMLIFFDGELLIPSLIVFLDLLLIWLLQRAIRAPSFVAYGLAGIVLGLSAIARPNILLFGPAVVAWLLIKYWGTRRQALIYVASVTIGCLLVILPVTIRNYVVGNDFVLIASQGGVNFYIGNNPEADGFSATLPDGPPDWWRGYHVVSERAEQELGRTLTPSEVSRFYHGKAWDFIRSEPGSFLTLTLRKLSYFWSRWEISNNKHVYLWTQLFTPVVRFLPLGFGLLGPLGLLGIVMCRRRASELFPLWGFILVYMASVIPFFCNARFRTPILPPLILLAVFAVFQAVQLVREARWKSVAGVLALLVASGLFVNITPDAAKFRRPGSAYFVTLGDAYEERDQLDLAAASYQRALAISPDSLTARFNLGKLLRRQQRMDEAIQQLRRAAETLPKYATGETDDTLASVHFNLASALEATGANADAVVHYERSIGLDPAGRGGRAFFNLGLTLRRLGRGVEAKDVFRRGVDPLREALRENPTDAKLWSSLGQSLFLHDEYQDSVEPLRQCLLLDPNDRWALDCLTEALVRLRRYEESANLLRRSLSPSQPRLTNRYAFLLATAPVDTLRNGEEALRLARQLCPDIEACPPQYLDTLAAAMAELGRFDEAISATRRAIQLAGGTGGRTEAFSHRLSLYESRRPHRLPSP